MDSSDWQNFGALKSWRPLWAAVSSPQALDGGPFMKSKAKPGLEVKRPPWLLTWPATFVGPLLSAAGAAVLPLSVTSPDGLVKDIRWVTDPGWFWFGLIGLPVGIVWALVGTSFQQNEASKLRSKLKMSKAKATEDVIHQLAPLIHDLGHLSESQSVNHGRDLVNRALSTVTKIIDVPNVRACLYCLDHVESKNATSLDIPNTLTLRTPHVGRFDAPRPNFVRGEGDASDDIFAVIDSGTSRLIEDVAKTGSVLDCTDKKYQTFLNVPVKFQTAEVGVLSVDAPDSSSLTNSHVLLAEMVAQLIAVGVRREQKNAQDRTPRPRRVSPELALDSADGHSGAI